jgi:hypothetical protein
LANFGGDPDRSWKGIEKWVTRRIRGDLLAKVARKLEIL